MPELYERDLAAVASVLHLRFYPLATTSGSGAWLVEEGGQRLLDLTAAFGAAGLGYAHRPSPPPSRRPPARWPACPR